MGALSAALSVALSGLQTSTSLIATASNNVSNAQTAGFTEKTANVTSVSYGTGGGGSAIASYTRATNAALTDNYNLSTTQSSYYGTQNSYMTQVQTILASTSTNPTLSKDIANFSSAWSQYSSDPTSSIQQQAVVSAGNTLAKDINAATIQIGSLDSQIVGDTQTTVTSLNSALKQVASLNQQIQQAQTAGQQTGGLLDQRDTLVNSISSYVGTSIQSRANGQIALYTTGGQLLVDSSQAVTFSYDGTNIKDQTGVTVTGSMTGGTLQAQLDFRDSSATALANTTAGVGVIGKLRAQLSTLAGSFINSGAATNSVFANAYSSAVTASTATGASQNGTTVDSNFFTASNNADGSVDTTTFVVNPNLVTGTSGVPQTNVQAVASSFNATATYTTSGLTATNVTYAQLGSAILSNFQQAANAISSISTSSSGTQSYYKTALSNATGVNIDTELANLVAYQNSYAAAAHVITTINQMLSTLMTTVG